MPAATADRSTSRGARFKFLGEIMSELKKVVWLSRQEVVYLTTLVLIIAVATGIFLGLVDYGFAALVSKFIH